MAAATLRVDRQVRQERLDLRRPERLRVALAVEKDEAFNPVDIRLLGPDAVVPEADLVADAVQQAWEGSVTPSTPVSIRSPIFRSPR